MIRHHLASCAAAALLAVGLARSEAASGLFGLRQVLVDPGTSPQADARHGYSVAIEGDVVVTGAPYDNLGGLDSGLAKVYAASSGALLHTLTNPTPAGSDRFGWSVAVSGSRVVIAAPGDGDNLEGGAVHIYDLASATPTSPVLTLTNPFPVSSTSFGQAVAIFGSRVVVGVPGQTTALGRVGGAFVYDLDGPSPAVPWMALSNPSATQNDDFGETVAISGSRVAVGAPGEDFPDSNAGVAYVYDLAGAAPSSPVLRVSNPTPAPGEVYFGSRLALAGTRLVLGNPWQRTGALATGCAYVFELTSPTPLTPWLTLTNPGPAADYSFGAAVAISGTRVVVGLLDAVPGGTGAGGARVYDLSSATPAVPLLMLSHPSPASNDVFGIRLALSGSKLVIGAPYDNGAAPHGGNSFLYDLAGATPTLPTATWNQPSPTGWTWFGQAVGVSGSWVVIGAPQYDTGAELAGLVRVYNLASATPMTPVFTLTNPYPAPRDLFGYAVGISGPRVVVGALYDSAGAPVTGSAYLYDLAGTTPTAPLFTLTNRSPVGDYSFGSQVSISGTRVAVGAYLDNTGAVDAGLVQIFDFASPNPRLPVMTLTNPTPAARDYFGWSVALSGNRVVVGARGDDALGVDAGVAHVYDLAGALPLVPILTLTNPSAASFDGFGLAVGIAGTRIVVGAMTDGGATDAGSAFVYDLAGAAPHLPFLTLTNPSPASGDAYGLAVAISETHVAIAAPSDDGGATNAGAIYVYELAGAAPAVPVATLRSPTPDAGDAFGHAMAMDGTTIVSGSQYDHPDAPGRGAAYVFGPVSALRIESAATPGFATLSWTPATGQGVVLQYAERLSPASWSNAPSGAANPVTVPLPEGARFYRLFRP